MNKEEYIKNNQGLISKLALKYSQFDPSYEFDDLMQVGNISMWKKFDSFDSNKKTKISTYLSICINNDMLKYIKKLQKHTCHHSVKYNLLDSYDQFEDIYINDIIESFPEIHKKILKLKICGLSNKKISKEVKRTQKFVKQALVRIRTKIENINEKKESIIFN
jgi:RNA polymerase sigma factor (sigma-70 family)